MNKDIKIIRQWLLFFMIALFLSGLTAIPLEQELAFLSRLFPPSTSVGIWLNRVYEALSDTNQRYPFMAYGYDWLAFAHFVLAFLFIGAWKDPVRNKWVIEFGINACVLVIPYALIAGHFRGIPLAWRFIDCAFGIIGLLPLGICYTKVSRIERAQLASQREAELLIFK